MILTGKAYNDFYNWLKYNYYQYYLSAHGNNPDSCNNSLIIEWFDSVGIYINISYELFSYKWNILGDRSYYDLKKYPTRQESTKQAIIKANDIYNSSKN